MVVVRGRDHLHFRQHVVVDRDSHLGDPLDQHVGAARFDVGDEYEGLGVPRLVGLLHDPAHALVPAQELPELLGPVVGDGGAQPQHPRVKRRASGP